MPESKPVSQYGAWRLSAIHEVQKTMLGCAEPMEQPEANMVVEAVLRRVAAALENEYSPQVHQNAHPADAITKLFELPGHEGIDMRRTYGT